MIVKMKKLTLLCARSDQHDAVVLLRELGVVHVTPERNPEGDDLEKARARLTYVRRALEVLPRHKNTVPSGDPGNEVIDTVWKLIHERDEISEKLDDLRHEAQRLQPYGSFDPQSIRELGEKGISVNLYRIGPKHEGLTVPDGVVLVELSRDEQGAYFAAIGCGALDLDAREVPLPSHSLDWVLERIAELERRRSACEASLQRHAGDYGVVANILMEAEEKVRFLETKFGMGLAEPVAYLKGYVPAQDQQIIIEAAERHGWGYRIDDPSPEDHPPSCVRNPRWVRPIKAVFEMIGVVPGYREADISAVFLLFLSIFFAILVGDAGYGLLFLGGALWGKLKLRHLPQHTFNLLLVMGSTTIIWGVLTGTYFGISRDALPQFMQGVDWLTNKEYSEANIMRMCFFIGAIHLTIAHVWNAVRQINSTRALAQMGWICTTWTMYFAALHMVISDPFPQVMFSVLIAGVVLIMLFMTPVRELKREWFGFVVLPLDLVGNFVDIVSYVRLFAVGSASFAVANAFNQMGMEMGWGSVWSGMGAALIILFGQVLNIMLCGMGVLVHGVRLNTLEFSGHLGMQWVGYRYEPFRKRKVG